MRAINYTYHIDLDERGRFMSHVENTRGRVVIAYDLPQYDCDTCGLNQYACQCGDKTESLSENWDIFEEWCGIVKHTRDVDGLERHYKECGIMPQSASLVLVK